jgi:hypothetical protein
VSPKFSIALDRPSVAPGGEVVGRVRVLEGSRSRRLSVALRYRDATADYRGWSIEIPGPTLHEGAFEAPAEYPFAIPLPADALPPLRGAHGRTWWEIEARSDELGPDAVARVEVTVDTFSR